MKLAYSGFRLSFFLSIVFFVFAPFFVIADVSRPDVNITPAGIIDSFSVPCSGTNATAILITGYPFQSYVGEYMRRPCLNGVVNFDSFDLSQYLTSHGGAYPEWFNYFKPPFYLVVKDTTDLLAPDAPIYNQIVNIVGPSNNYSVILLSPINKTYPTLAIGSSFYFTGLEWVKTPPPPAPLPPETIGDPNNLPANISLTGDVPRVSINCTIGHDYTLSLVHREDDYVFRSFGVKQREYCVDGVVSFDGFNIVDFFGGQSISWWLYFYTPIEYIIKDTTGIYECNEYYCPLVSLISASNNFDTSLYLASSTRWATVGKGPIYDVDETHTVWSNKNQTQPTGNSNVMFIPGLMGSRLYEQTGIVDCGSSLAGSDCIDDNELWVSSSDSDQEKLSLDSNGKSINSVYTKNDTQSLNDEVETGIVDEAYGANIYNSFINDLRNWKTDGTIKDYAFIPYDWRLSLEDIITDGATSTLRNKLYFTNPQGFTESFILKKLEELQKSSNSGKVTIIAHSNGGLVAKALVQKLKDTNNPLYYKIDKIILVAVPQVGTPDAIAGLLHGTELGWHGLVMSSARSRQLAENMPTIYNLLPTPGYFSTVDQSYNVDKVVSFSNDPSWQQETSQYGTYISDPANLKNYILGSDGRVKPSYSDTNSASIGNSNLYSDSEVVHSILDNWQPASTTKVIQVAGWGEETLAGIDYKNCRYYYIGKLHKCYSPRVVVDGDGVVVVPSALWMATSSPNVERWWVNIKDANILLGIKRTHRDILEITNLRSFIKSEVINNNFIDDSKIVVNNPSTLVSQDTRLHYTLHSPLTLGITDSQGRYTGIDPATKQLREEIPGVIYRKIGETQYISVPEDISHTLKLKGYDDGSFSLDIDEQTGNVSTQITSFQGVPTSTTTIATLDYTTGMNLSSTTLNVDLNSDGNIDLSLNAKLGELVDTPFYKWNGFLQPINDTKYHPEQSSSVFKGGSTVPVKFVLKDFYGNLVQASSSPKWLVPEKLSPMSSPISESITSTTATSGSDFRWDSSSQQYVYNWSTKGLISGYWYKISAKLDDGYVYSVVVGLK
ncbi:MAG: lecithin-cholesterol acyltransferase [Parcubacteria bacterium C7867-006]|nr:MAG: lecithin-cholesterol acyltransferase [Parcubacteria bacterium C7867-006]